MTHPSEFDASKEVARLRSKQRMPTQPHVVTLDSRWDWLAEGDEERNRRTLLVIELDDGRSLMGKESPTAHQPRARVRNEKDGRRTWIQLSRFTAANCRRLP